MKIISNLGKQKPTPSSNYVKDFVMAECDCGNIFKAQLNSIISGHTKSCGCLKKKALHMIKTKHLRDFNPRLYRIWKNMKSRSLNKNIPSASVYSLRGITICDQWLEFEPFFKWSIDNGYSDSLSIDRINVDGPYDPSNCRWATRKEQSSNTQLLRSTNTSGFRGVSRKDG